MFSSPRSGIPTYLKKRPQPRIDTPCHRYRLSWFPFCTTITDYPELLSLLTTTESSRKSVNVSALTLFLCVNSETWICVPIFLLNHFYGLLSIPMYDQDIYFITSLNCVLRLLGQCVTMFACTFETFHKTKLLEHLN